MNGCAVPRGSGPRPRLQIALVHAYRICLRNSVLAFALNHHCRLFRTFRRTQILDHLFERSSYILSLRKGMDQLADGLVSADRRCPFLRKWLCPDSRLGLLDQSVLVFQGGPDTWIAWSRYLRALCYHHQYI